MPRPLTMTDLCRVLRRVLAFNGFASEFYGTTVMRNLDAIEAEEADKGHGTGTIAPTESIGDGAGDDASAVARPPEIPAGHPGQAHQASPAPSRSNGSCPVPGAAIAEARAILAMIPTSEANNPEADAVFRAETIRTLLVALTGDPRDGAVTEPEVQVKAADGTTANGKAAASSRSSSGGNAPSSLSKLTEEKGSCAGSDSELDAARESLSPSSASSSKTGPMLSGSTGSGNALAAAVRAAVSRVRQEIGWCEDVQAEHGRDTIGYHWRGRMIGLWDAAQALIEAMEAAAIIDALDARHADNDVRERLKRAEELLLELRASTMSKRWQDRIDAVLATPSAGAGS